MIKKIVPVDLHLPGADPFLFCAHHLDHFPQGNAGMGLDLPHLEGRDIGHDFQSKDGFRMYHGSDVPGFPVHPHRGFETITIARQGFIDHADSLGAAGRFGEGDVQWMTAGKGVQHSEMFPLLNEQKGNTMEIFQIWLNLPKKNKMVDPEFKMLWSQKIPKYQGDNTEVTVIHGKYKSTEYFASTEASWAKDPKHEVNIFLVNLKKGATFEMPKAATNTNRIIYLYQGGKARIQGQSIAANHAAYLDGSTALQVTAEADLDLLYLEGQPINEPVVQHGPFVMNTKQEIIDAINDYNETQFGGWSWDRSDAVHDKLSGRFAKYPDGKIEKP
ncbi:pirin family protein [Bdellovibrio sp. HCB288]|uniref:pirin family protein n=1 Tax=Bdellovibrio sp. HCB288 TaxID=3394355 RepID=UPI0039B6E691